MCDHIPDQSRTSNDKKSMLRSELRERQSEETILIPNPSRWVLLPVEYPTLFEFYKWIEGSFWTPEDFAWGKFDQSNVLRGFSAFPKHYNLFCGVPAGVLGAENRVDAFLFHDILDLTCELTEAIQSPEGRAFLGFQALFENFHKEAFTKWIEEFDQSATSMSTYLQIQTSPTLRAKALFIQHHLEGFHSETKVKVLVGDELCLSTIQGHADPAPMSEVLIALAILKGLFFSGCQIAARLLDFSNPIAKAADKIFSDVTLHADFCLHLYWSLRHSRLPDEFLASMLAEAVVLEFNHVAEVMAIPIHSVENDELMNDVAVFLRHLAKRLLYVAGCESAIEKLPTIPIPGTWMAGDARRFPIPPLRQFQHRGDFKVEPAESAPPVSSGEALVNDPDEDF